MEHTISQLIRLFDEKRVHRIFVVDQQNQKPIQ